MASSRRSLPRTGTYNPENTASYSHSYLQCSSDNITYSTLSHEDMSCADIEHGKYGECGQECPIVQDRLPWLLSLNKLLWSWEREGREEVLPSAVVGGVEAEARSRGSDAGVQGALRRSDTGVQGATTESDVGVQGASRGSDVEVQGASMGSDVGVIQTASRGHNIGVRGVLACSALKRDYRQILASGFKGEDLGSTSSCCVFVVLKGTKALIGERMRGREHFMPPGLLQSQFDALEPPTAQEGHKLIVVTDISAPVARITEYILTELELLSHELGNFLGV